MALQVFGKNPSGKELEKIQHSPNYHNKQFQNLEHTGLLSDESMIKVLWKFINKPKDTIPSKPLPSVKTDLKNLSDGMIVWFGHSSYLLKINGLNILVDPVFSGHASPFSFTTKSFAGTDVYTVEDLPAIDILIISHDHYDHLDYETIIKLKSKTKLICTSLGVAAHFIYWGFDKEKIVEFDWWDHHTISNGIGLTTAPARHFAGRTFVRNKRCGHPSSYKQMLLTFLLALIVVTAIILKPSIKNLVRLILPFLNAANTILPGMIYICYLKKQCRLVLILMQKC